MTPTRCVQQDVLNKMRSVRCAQHHREQDAARFINFSIEWSERQEERREENSTVI